MATKEELRAGGFLFGSKADAETAAEEIQKIEYLDQKVNYQNLARTKALYEKALEGKTFQTPVGWNYMIRLRRIMLEGGIPEDEIAPVPLYTTFVHDAEEARPRAVTVKRVNRTPSYRGQFRTSFLLNLLLILLLIGMFVIALRSDTPNMLNYRQKIVNEYSGWEQELTEREQRVREKERELQMVDPSDANDLR